MLQPLPGRGRTPRQEQLMSDWRSNPGKSITVETQRFQIQYEEGASFLSTSPSPHPPSLFLPERGLSHWVEHSISGQVEVCFQLSKGVG